MTRYFHPMHVYDTRDGWTWGVLAYEEPAGFCVWDEGLQMFIGAGITEPVAMLSLGEPYETPDGRI
ncbi:hypothetical protein ACIBK9_47225 [Nonomuraea sp. NPDC050227]|uniref:hypothetical protein n=1 Tax=Nonomuraea sp. NPDC050227 TaxID=3364360 RepID=UPI0037A2DCAA